MKQKNDIEKIANELFSGGEIKSSNIANNDSRRIKVIGRALDIPFSIFALVVDKASLNSKGLGYKKSFLRLEFH